MGLLDESQRAVEFEGAIACRPRDECAASHKILEEIGGVAMFGVRILCLWFVAVVSPLPVFAAGHASIGDYGFDATGMDPSVRPGDDFNEYANGAWAQRTSIPRDHRFRVSRIEAINPATQISIKV